MLLPPPSLNGINYARVLKSSLQLMQYQQVWVSIPLTTPIHYRATNAAPDGWLSWNNLRHGVSHNPHLYVALELNTLPEDANEEVLLANLSRWRGEPTRCLILPTKHFITNKSGYPVLPKVWQNILGHLLRITNNVNVILKGKARIAGNLLNYVEYIKHMRHVNRIIYTDYERSFMNYWDIIQSPLQPLMDNLESGTYETFEKDVPKYTQYTSAIEKALVDIRGVSSGEEVLVVYVVGAGRGPLVKCALDAR
jgi:type II protein arginine methyltransferase